MMRSLLRCVPILALLVTGCSDAQPPPADNVDVQTPTSAGGDTPTEDVAPTGTHHAIEVNDATFTREVLASKQPVLVDFWAPWCGPCRELTPIVEQIAAEYEGRVTVAKVNVDEAPDVAARYDVTAIPTLLFLQDGQMVESMLGVQSKRTLTKTLDAMLAE